jgi:hypothetical protein
VRVAPEQPDILGCSPSDAAKLQKAPTPAGAFLRFKYFVGAALVANSNEHTASHRTPSHQSHYQRWRHFLVKT